MPFAAVFRLRCMFVLSFVFGTFAASYLIRFQLSRLFLNKLDVWLFVCLYSLSCCRFLFRLILNRKLLGIFEFSLAPLRKRLIFLLFVFSLFLLYWYFKLKKKLKLKIRFFAVFCLKTSLFVANKLLIISDLWVYRASYTPQPRFWH